MLLATTMAMVPLAFAVPLLPHADLLGFAPLSASVCAALAGITVLYVAAAEAGKRRLYRSAGATYRWSVP